jgi:hypothetical protein
MTLMPRKKQLPLPAAFREPPPRPKSQQELIHTAKPSATQALPDDVVQSALAIMDAVMAQAADSPPRHAPKTTLLDSSPATLHDEPLSSPFGNVTSLETHQTPPPRHPTQDPQDSPLVIKVYQDRLDILQQELLEKTRETLGLTDELENLKQSYEVCGTQIRIKKLKINGPSLDTAGDAQGKG